jgi:hypothetical protein
MSWMAPSSVSKAQFPWSTWPWWGNFYPIKKKDTRQQSTVIKKMYGLLATMMVFLRLTPQDCWLVVALGQNERCTDSVYVFHTLPPLFQNLWFPWNWVYVPLWLYWSNPVSQVLRAMTNNQPIVSASGVRNLSSFPCSIGSLWWRSLERSAFL